MKTEPITTDPYIAETLGEIAKSYTRLLVSLRPTRRLRVGNFAFVLREGLDANGWSRVWWRLWRYREADERALLQRHADLWGLASIPGETVKQLRERILDSVRRRP